jgi:hypothetical protein
LRLGVGEGVAGRAFLVEELLALARVTARDTTDGTAARREKRDDQNRN